MRKVLASLLIGSLLAAPAAAANWQDQTIDTRAGAFLGARLKLPLGHSAAAKPRAELAFAPTQSRISGGGLVRTRIGEGVTFGLTPNAKPTLTLAGVRADTALDLTQGGQSKAAQKIGISAGGWVAIGVGAVLVGLGAFYLYVKEAEECHEADGGADCA